MHPGNLATFCDQGCWALLFHVLCVCPSAAIITSSRVWMPSRRWWRTRRRACTGTRWGTMCTCCGRAPSSRAPPRGTWSQTNGVAPARGVWHYTGRKDTWRSRRKFRFTNNELKARGWEGIFGRPRPRLLRQSVPFSARRFVFSVAFLLNEKQQ